MQAGPPAHCTLEKFSGSPVECSFTIDRIHPSLPIGGEYTLDVTFFDGYPFRPPELRFTCRLYHLNMLILVDGTSIFLNYTQQWIETGTTFMLLTHIVDVLLHPDPKLLPDAMYEIYQLMEEEGRRCGYITRGSNDDEACETAKHTVLPSLDAFMTPLISQKALKLSRIEKMHLAILFTYLFDRERYQQSVLVYASHCRKKMKF